jgi:hypothetical protein
VWRVWGVARRGSSSAGSGQRVAVQQPHLVESIVHYARGQQAAQAAADDHGAPRCLGSMRFFVTAKRGQRADVQKAHRVSPANQ